MKTLFRSMALPRCLLVLALSNVNPLDLRWVSEANTVQHAPDAVPAGHQLSVMTAEEWLPEPFQSTYFKVPPLGTPLKGCASVVGLSLEPAGPALEKPVTITFSCEGNTAGAEVYAYLLGRWSRYPHTVDENGHMTISATNLTTFALLKLEIS